ncbi:hypothetical protein Tco_1337217 [Tanacetum coccineum]
MRGCTILWVLPQSISTVTGYVLMKPVIRKVWEDDIPKYAAADKDHNCGVGVSSCGTGSFGAGRGWWSSLSTMMRNWGRGTLVSGGQIFLGNESKGLLSGVVGGLRGLWVEADGGVLVGGVDVGLVDNSLGKYGLLGLGWWVILSSTSWARPHASCNVVGLRMASSDWISGLRPEIKQFFRVCGDKPVTRIRGDGCCLSVGTKREHRRGFVPSNDGSRIFGGLGLCEYDEEGDSLCFGKFMCGVLLGSVVRVSERLVMWVTKFAVVAVWASILVVKDLVASIKAVSWVVLRSAAVLVAVMSWVRRSVSGGGLSSPVVSRRGGMAAGELRMKAPNDGTTMRLGEERKK